jgi:membrane protease YdiL (CAAX protease family)
MAWVLAYLGFAFLAVLGFFHPLPRPRGERGDFRAFLIYFAAFFVFFFLGPCVLIAVITGGGLASLEGFGLTPGNVSRGLTIIMAGAPLSVLSGWIGSGDRALRGFYPFSKEACRSVGSFAAFELAYIILYYPAWEFLFRGVLFFPFVPAIGLLPALAIQTTLSTLYHIGHPPSEILASAVAGIIFGLAAFWTGSFLYGVVLHAAVGVSTDTFIYLRFYRGRSA